MISLVQPACDWFAFVPGFHLIAATGQTMMFRGPAIFCRIIVMSDDRRTEMFRKGFHCAYLFFSVHKRTIFEAMLTSC